MKSEVVAFCSFCYTARMSTDENLALLMEVRDLLKQNQVEMREAKMAQHRSMMFHTIFNAIVFLFVCMATYYYYHTMVTTLG